ncbi:MAG: hypothetical protein ABIA04_04855 [Pseudomonadota bacterium]
MKHFIIKTVLIIIALFAYFSLNSCAPSYSLDVFIDDPEDSIYDLYYQDGNIYWFSIETTSGAQLFLVEYSGRNNDSFRTDDLPIGTDLLPKIEVYDASGTLILTGSLSYTDNPGATNSSAISIEDGIITEVNMSITTP